MPDHEDSLGGETLDGDAKADRAEQSLGDGSTLGGGDTSSLSDTNDGEGDHLAAGLPVIDLGARFEIEGELGQGGMGAVLLARDKSLGRQVAIKRILGTMIRSSATISRFIIEAKSIAALNHNNIVQIHEFGQDADGPLIVIEYVSGGSLLERLRKGKLDPEEAIRITCQLCDALTLAHGKGIIHRDLKPANVLMTEDGVPKLTDFGLAKDESTDTGVTEDGSVLGTPDYMAPEQRRDSTSVDERSDLWSLAATFYHTLTGKSPKVIRERDIPVNMRDFLMQALEEDPADRFASAAEFKKALDSTASNVIATPVKELTSGVCPACNAVNGENRKFCGECAESLRAVCLGCDIEMAVWDKICGECGGSQTDLRQQAAEKEAEIRDFLDNGDWKAVILLDPNNNEALRLKTTAEKAVGEKVNAEKTVAMVAGKYVIFVIFGTALAMAVFAWQFRISEGDGVLDYWGVESANLLRHANNVELIKLDSADTAESDSTLTIDGTLHNIFLAKDISSRKGLIHARHMLILDHTYLWKESSPVDIQSWDFALRFRDGGKEVTLVFHTQSRTVQMLNNNKPLIMGPMFDNLLYYLTPMLAPQEQ
ncbi:MAG: protein kinase [Planctomycetaceae bacterium]|nr:protein kinase [Planctomycetaceae bacterium]